MRRQRAIPFCAAAFVRYSNGERPPTQGVTPKSGPGGMPAGHVWGVSSMEAPIFPGEAPKMVGRDGARRKLNVSDDLKQQAVNMGAAAAASGVDFMHEDQTPRGGTRAGFDFRDSVKGNQRGGPRGATGGAAGGAGGGGAGGERAPRSVDEVDPADKPLYAKSADQFANRRIVLDEKYSGDAKAQEILWWERLWWNYIKYPWTRDILVGKDRFGNHFTASWYYLRSRHEIRKCHRRDAKKQFQPYGCLPTDDRLWEAWLRGWRNDPPTIDECEFLRKKKMENMGMHRMEGEEYEDAVVRLLASSRSGGERLQEIDEHGKYQQRLLMNTEERIKEANVKDDWEGSFSLGFVRGDMFYNEEEVEVMRSTIASVYHDREWQALEMKRQTRLRKTPNGAIGKPKDEDLDDPNAMGQPIGHDLPRTDANVPMHQGIAELTTPELERIRAECDALEDERLALRKELGLVDLTDFREGRDAIDRGFDPFQPPPTSGRWKPKVWQESWGDGGRSAPLV